MVHNGTVRYKYLIKCKNSNQSPINIIISNTVKIYDNIFIDFKNPDYCRNQCKKPLIKNTGLGLEIIDDCGMLMMPPHMNGYSCHKIEIHTRSEHYINSKQYDLELQIHFKITDKRIIDKKTTDNVILVVLVNGNDNNDVVQPFFKSLELSDIPIEKGHARMLSDIINYSFLFNDIKLKKDKSNIEDALGDLKYDKHHPIDEFYLYYGSYTSPPCSETVTYIISARILSVSWEQIIFLTRSILKNNIDGNNRNLQVINSRKIYYYKKQEYLNLTDLLYKKEEVLLLKIEKQ
jgi:carbonic anhydrase